MMLELQIKQIGGNPERACDFLTGRAARVFGLFLLLVVVCLHKQPAFVYNCTDSSCRHKAELQHAVPLCPANETPVQPTRPVTPRMDMIDLS